MLANVILRRRQSLAERVLDIQLAVPVISHSARREMSDYGGFASGGKGALALPSARSGLDYTVEFEQQIVQRHSVAGYL